MDLSGAVEWWEEWQLRILVLGSLFVQYFLCLSLYVRTHPILRRLRSVVWIAYIGGDAMAIYALATLFNRHQRQTTDGAGSSTLEVIWAPVLLIHLGGQPWISAYSLEDNELWRRHAVTLVSQVTVALYVFCKWWSGEKRLLQAAVLLFVVGIIKFGQKPWALRRASFSGILDDSTGPPPRREDTFSFTYWCWKLCIFDIWDILFATTKQTVEQGKEDLVISLEEYVQRANKCVQDMEVANHLEENATNPQDYILQMFVDIAIKENATNPQDYIFQMFVDMSAQYSGRLIVLQQFAKCSDKDAYKALQNILAYTFVLLYTKIRSSASLLVTCLEILLPFLASASLVLFAMSHKDGYNENDIQVTYILFCCTVMQEFLPFLPTSCLTTHLVDWHDIVSQYNIMSFCARERKPTILMNLATFDCLRKYVNKHWYIWQVPAAHQITQLVLSHTKNGWKEYIHDTARYRRFNDLRGQQALGSHHQLGWSLKVPFDESVLLWHIATDLCFHHPNTTPRSRQEPAMQRSREISNYMIYLLFIRPEMLMPGTKSGLFTAATDDIKLILKDSKEPLDKEEMLAREIVDVVRFSTQELGHTINEVESPTTTTAASSRTLVPKSCRLAEELMKMDEEEERWTVIQNIWVEMLCYSASRCRGYLHAKGLGEGGEYLSTVWLLWSCMGMETLADRCQRSEPPQEGGE